jgi:probable HAF family extracellular repeat protein
MKNKIIEIFVCMLLIISAFSVSGIEYVGKTDLNLPIEEFNNDVEYNVTDLGTLGGIWSSASGINSMIYVVGSSSIYSGAQHAFLWMDDMIYDLETPSGYLVSGATDVNDLGQVIGYARGQYQSQYAYIWEDGNWSYLGTLPDLDYSSAYDINNASQIVGYSFILGPGGGSRGWIYEDGDMTDIGTLGGNRSVASGINELGQVVGVADTNETGINHAFLWEDGEMTDLGVLPNETDSSAADINENGQICGVSSHTVQQYPFPTYLTACLWDNGDIINIGKLPGYTRNSAASAINNQGQVIGYSSNNGNQPHAFIWEEGILTDLNNLIPSDSGWELKSASDIDELGRIVGYGTYDSETRAFLLTPISLLNQPPVLSDEEPIDGSTDVSVTMTSLSVNIEDPDGDSFNWEIQTSPDIGSSSGDDEYNGTKTCSISGLDYNTTYTWFVNATDSGSGETTSEFYTFTTESYTENKPPVFSNENPISGQKDVPISFSSISIIIEDLEGDSFDWTIMTIPDIGSSSGTGEYSGTKTCDISDLEYDTMYAWYVNATDTGSGKTTEEIYMFKTQKENNPPDTPIINGPPTGKSGIEYEYTFISTDPDDDSIMYFINWGDNHTEWTEYSNSGVEIKLKHAWDEKGDYTIKAKAEDIYGDESGWGTLDIIMPKNKPFIFNFPLLNWLFDRFPNIFSMLRFIFDVD